MVASLRIATYLSAMTKRCSGCKQQKPREEFGRNRSTKDGLQHHCKACNAEWRDAHRAEAKLYFQDYRSKNRDRLTAFDKTKKRKAQKRRNRISPRGRVLNLLSAARGRAKAFGVPFSLSVDDVQIPERCPVLGFPLVLDRRCDQSPSLDRVEREKGYVKGNVVVVSARANRIKSDATIPELCCLVEFYNSLGPPSS